MSGYLEDLSSKQEETLKQFKRIIDDVLEDEYDDRLLLQFLRARNFDLKKTENMFRKHVSWRKIYPKKFILEEYNSPELIEKHLPVPFLGFDKEGSPIRVLPCGAYDLKGALNTFKPHTINQQAAYILEKDRVAAAEYNKKFNRYVEGRTLIFDLANLKFTSLFHKPVFDYAVSLLKLYESNYPESLKTAYVINIPYFFSWIFGILKSIADEKTLRKIHVFGENGWKEAMLEHIDADVIPDWLGHPDYVTMCGFSTSIPQKYYLRNQNVLQKDTENVHEVYLKRRSKQEMPVYVNSSGSTIVWSVECPDGDINVGLFYKNTTNYDGDQFEETKMEEVIPFSRVGGDFGPLTGSYDNTKTGVYVLVFDNGFSFIKSKYIMYTFDVLPSVSDMIPETTNMNNYEVTCVES